MDWIEWGARLFVRLMFLSCQDEGQNGRCQFTCAENLGVAMQIYHYALTFIRTIIRYILFGTIKWLKSE